MTGVNAASALERGSADHPDRPAILFEGGTITYGALDERVGRVAGELVARGVRAGDRVALLLPNTPDFVASYLGVLRIGAIAVSLVSGLLRDEVRALLADCGANVLITTETLWEKRAADGLDVMYAGPRSTATPIARSVLVAPESPAAILYTSGTTGTPRGATLSHANLLFTMRAKQRYLGIRPDDRLLLFLPLFHCFGQNAILHPALHAGATIVLHRSFDADAVLASVERDGVTMFFGVPATWSILLGRATPEQLSSIRYFFSAAAPLPIEVEERWESRFGKVLHQGYGLTESSPFATYNHETRHRRGSIGTPIDEVEMRVVDVDTGAEMPCGERGELVIRGPNVMLGYWNRPEETATVLRGGWLHTGDLGRVDADGYFAIEDRLKDMIIVGGFKVYPAEVERVLCAHPAVAEVAVYGAPDPVMGERVCASVVPRSDVEVDTLHAWCRERIAAFKVPVEIALAKELPRNRAGKVLKRVLRDAHAREMRTLPAPAPAPILTAADLERRLRSWLTAKLSIDPSDFESTRPFAEYGLTSVGAVELAEELGRWLGRAVSPVITWQFPTTRALARHLAEAPAAARRIESASAKEVQSIA